MQLRSTVWLLFTVVACDDEVVPRFETATASAVPALSAALPRACPKDMIHVRGRYCPEPKRRCLKRLAGSGSLGHAPCIQYAQGAECQTERRVLAYCIDRDESRSPGRELPDNDISLNEASEVCRQDGKRLCSFAEWVFACEGEAMRPFPYGYAEDGSACHAGVSELQNAQGELIDHRRPPGSHPRCQSSFGVRDLVGNLQEHVVYERAKAGSALMGGYWQPAHAGCRDAQTAHDRDYRGTETGFRCCRDADGG